MTGPTRATLLVLTVSLSLAVSSNLRAQSGTATASTGGVLAEATKAKKLTDPPPVAVVGVLEDELAGSCTLRATRDGEPRKGVKGTFDATLIDGNTGNLISDLGTKSGKTGKDGLLSVDYPVPRLGGFSVQAAMLVDLNLGGGKKITEYEFSCELVDETP